MKRKSREIELRLLTAAAAHRRLGGATALASLAVSSPRTTQQLSVYWDTPTLRLRAANLALRLRRIDDGRWIQTLKVETQEPHTRDEYHRLVTACRPDLKLLRRRQGSDANLPDVDEDELQPVFCTHVVRTTRTVTFDDGTVAELSLDRGDLSVGHPESRREPIREIEIELVTGSPRKLYELADRLVAELPSTRLLFSSKSQRGYELCSRISTSPRRALGIDIPHKSRPGSIAYRAAAEALVQVQRSIELARAGRDPEGVHQMRIGVRRLRVCAAIARKAGVATFSDKLGSELKWLWRILGEARDWDVFAVETWPAVICKSGKSAPLASEFEASTAGFRNASHQKLRRALGGRRFQTLMLACGYAIVLQREALPRASARRSSRQFAQRLLSKRAARVLDHGNDIAGLHDRQRHQLRIDAKKLRYLAEFFAALYPPEATRRYLERLGAVQSILGRLNNLAVSEAMVRPAPRRPDQSPIAASCWRHGKHFRRAASQHSRKDSRKTGKRSQWQRRSGIDRDFASPSDRRDDPRYRHCAIHRLWKPPDMRIG